MREQYLEYQVGDQMVKTISKSVQNGGKYGDKKKRENTLMSLARALLRIENFHQGTIFRVSSKGSDGENHFLIGSIWRQKWRPEQSGKRINVSGSRIITDGELS